MTRNTAGHGFKRRDAETFPSLRSDEQVERLVPARHGVHRRLGQEPDPVFETRPGHLVAEGLLERLVLSRRTAHDQGLRIRVIRQHFQHRVDEYIRTLLVADAPETPDSEAFGQTERIPERSPVGGWAEGCGIDSMRYHLRRPPQVGRGPAGSGDHGVHAQNQEAGIARVIALRRRGEHELQALPQDVTQEQPEKHLGVSPRMPDTTLAAGHQNYRPERHTGNMSRQSRTGRHDPD